MKNKDIFKNLSYAVMPFLGILFMLWYIKAAGCDTVYSDYIRIIADYLPDVDDLSKLLVPDILTRIPATFLARFINVTSFGYSVTFDRLLAVSGIAIMAGVLAVYFYKYKIGFLWQAIIYILLFSLTKWEILLNGTAWAHVVSFGLFFICYFLFDKLWRGETNSKEELVLFIMPLFFILIAGEYIASFAVTMILFSILGILMGGANSSVLNRRKSLYKGILISTAAALIIYMASRSFAVWEHSGATDESIFSVLGSNPLFFIKFFFNTFAGAVIGQETIANFFGSGEALSYTVVTAIGAVMCFSYIVSLYVYIRSGLFEKTLFPAILLISGFLNHILITISRWIFLSEAYALSSRYAGQFMIGLIGMIIIFSMYKRQKRELKGFGSVEKNAARVFAAVSVVLITAGNCYTTYQEIGKAKYREENYTHMAEVIRHYEDYEEEELKSVLEWTKDSETLYKSLEILKDNGLNVFGRP